MRSATRLAAAVGLGALALAAPVQETFAQPAEPGYLPEIAIGRSDAPVTLVEHADPTCSACAEFHAKVLPGLKAKHIDTGTVRLIFRGFPTNTVSVVALMAVHCAGTDKAFALAETLFRHQGEWRASATLGELRARLLAFSRQADVAADAFDRCVPAANGSKMDLSPSQQKLMADVRGAGESAKKEHGITELPTFFINGKRVRGATLPAFEAAIAAALKQ